VTRSMRSWPILLVVLLLALAAGCGDDDDSEDTVSAGGSGNSDLQAACGDKVVVQTDWYPAGNHAALYELAGPGGEQDTKKGLYSNEIGDTGVVLEIRAGGPFIGFQGDVSTLYQDPDILLGYVNTSEAIAFSKTQPVKGVVTPYEKNPQFLFWNPDELDITTFADLGKSGATVLVFDAEAVWVKYMIAKGWLKADQVDGSFDGSPTRFVAENGKIVQQGFVTHDPTYYEELLEEWKKPIGSLLVHDSGLEDYPQVLSARPDVIEGKADCLKLLVPQIQQAQVDWMEDPAATNKLLRQLSKALKAPATNDCCLEEEHQAAVEDELVSNGPNATLGDFDEARVQELIDITAPIYEGSDTYDPDVTPEVITTNEFIDTSIGLK
jgi:ABC-type nitrate/sulfonate/bicarbonate transport system substrate-binding protein